MSIKHVFSLVMALTLTAWQLAGHAEPKHGERAMALSVEAEIVAIDHTTRELSLRTPMGDVVSMTAGEQVERLDEFKVGDTVVTTYMASIEGDLRKPTEEEKAEPWVELDAAAIAGLEELPGAAVGRVIQAVCTIEGLNRVLGTVTIMDPRGKLHVIGDVEAEKMEGVVLGDTIVITYSEAIAITLERKQAASDAG